MSKIWFILLCFSIITIGSCAQPPKKEPPKKEPQKKSNLETTVHNVSEKVLTTAYKVAAPVVTTPLKLTWQTTVGTILTPLGIPLEILSKILTFFNNIIGELIHNVAESSREATHEAKDSSSKQQPTASSRRRRQILASKASFSENLFRSVRSITNGFFGQQFLTSLRNSYVVQLIYKTNIGANIMRALVYIINCLKPLLDYFRDELLPTMVVQAVQLERSEYVSINTINKIDNLKEGYKILSLLGYVPPLTAA